jgi:hypothetical protein
LIEGTLGIVYEAKSDSETGILKVVIRQLVDVGGSKPRLMDDPLRLH